LAFSVVFTRWRVNTGEQGLIALFDGSLIKIGAIVVIMPGLESSKQKISVVNGCNLYLPHFESRRGVAPGW
jgi:hypothetical protein